METRNILSQEEFKGFFDRCKFLLSSADISDATKTALIDAVERAVKGDHDFTDALLLYKAAELERLENIKKSWQPSNEFLDALEELKPEPPEMLNVIADAMGFERDEKGIQAARKEYGENGLQALKSKPDSGKAYAATSPFIRSVYNPELRKRGIEFINPETGEIATFKLLSGFMTPAEIDFVEAIIKFYDQGQITKDGEIWATADQLGRAMGMQSADGSLTKQQREEIYETINALSSDERRISVDFNAVYQVYGGFEATGLEDYRIIDFHRWRGKKIRGKKIEYLYVFKFSDALKVIAGFMANNIRFGTVINQEVKSVKTLRYAVEYAKPTEKGTKQTSVRTFATERERAAFIRLNGIKAAQIVKQYTDEKPFSMTKQRRSIRSVVFNFAISYYRARNAAHPANFDPRLPYAKIWEACRADGCTATESAKQRIRNVEIVHTMFEWLKHCGVISEWKPYRNANSKRDDGVRVSITKAIEEGA